MRLGALHAWISVDGVEVSEFAVEYSADRTEVSCWIPSECNKNFCIHWKNTESSSRHTANALVTVDGICCGSNNMYCHDRAHPRVASGSRDSVATSAFARRPLFFGQQELTDDDALLNAAISPELGSIKVEMRNVRSVPSRSPRQTFWRGTPSFETKVLHERSKKAMGHSVRFGAEFFSANSQSDPVEVLEDLATFIFKYRPIDILRAQGIAPPVVSAKPVASSTGVVDLTLDDDDATKIRKLEARLRILKKAKAKTERSGVKRETLSSGEVIDLT
ncbi:hypothetical protein B0H19DRAFT_86584 [Mycena capillaripes]|nr:hypothetical protein B0H19DRAFT_86584 [Mycena capillaripes]